MPDPIDRLNQLQQQVGALLQRVEQLEVRSRPPDAPPARDEPQPPRLDPTAGLGDGGPSGQGFLTYDGSVEFGGKNFKIQSRRPVAAAFSADPETVARIFAALGSPHRVLMLRAMCDGPKTGQQLEDYAGISSTGQLYHHLKELLGAGLVTQPARSLYELRPAAVIGVCVALMLASDLAERPTPPRTPSSAAEPEPWPEDV